MELCVYDLARTHDSRVTFNFQLVTLPIASDDFGEHGPGEVFDALFGFEAELFLVGADDNAEDVEVVPGLDDQSFPDEITPMLRLSKPPVELHHLAVNFDGAQLWR